MAEPAEVSGADLAGWEHALDRMEADVAAVLAQAAPSAGDEGATDVLSWQPPSGLGPLPMDLAERARRLAAAQQETISRLQLVATSHRKHAALIDTIPTAGGGSRAVYLDTTG